MSFHKVSVETLKCLSTCVDFSRSNSVVVHMDHDIGGNFNIIQLLPLCEGNMTVCSPEAGNIARGCSPRVILPVESEQIKDNNCFIIPTCFIISFSL